MKVLLSAIYPYIYLLLFFTIPFDEYTRALPNILLLILVLTFPFIVKKEDFKKIKSIAILIFFGFCLYLLFNSLLKTSLQEDFTVIKKVLLSLGLVILYIPVQDFEKIKKAIVLSSLAAIVFSVINIVVLTNTINDFHFGSSPIVIEALLIDRLYLGFLCVLSILVSYSLLKENYHPVNRYYLANIIINSLFLFLIASKVSILLLALLILLRQLYRKNKKVGISIVILTVLIISSLFILAIKSNEDKKESAFLQNFITNTTTWEVRSITWQCAFNVIENHTVNWKGFGFYGTKNQMVSCYQDTIQNEYKKNQFISKRYNTHNQFLDFYLSTGILGFLLFGALILVLFIKNRKSFFYTALLASLVLYCMVENVFQRQMGAYYIGFILIILLSNKSVVQNKIINEE